VVALTKYENILWEASPCNSLSQTEAKILEHYRI
jgi:hypothetical protein